MVWLIFLATYSMFPFPPTSLFYFFPHLPYQKLPFRVTSRIMMCMGQFTPYSTLLLTALFIAVVWLLRREVRVSLICRYQRLEWNEGIVDMKLHSRTTNTIMFLNNWRARTQCCMLHGCHGQKVWTHCLAPDWYVTRVHFDGTAWV